jgi:hypothetical protein
LRHWNNLKPKRAYVISLRNLFSLGPFSNTF